MYAAAKASAARSAILRGSAELLTWRARVEKYLQADPKRAGECYEELLKVRSRLTAALGDARLALLELEEYARARTAGKLQAGLAGFNLMSRAYKPVYEALRSFADKLPENPDSVNAKTIGRLMNQVRMGYDEDVDAMKYCIQAERLFELYQTCANRKQIETICLKFLRSLDATKVSVNGHLYFVPRHTMEQVVVFETFIEEVSRLNRNNTPLFANSFYLIDDAKQRDKMTEEFYLAVKKEIAQYQERADYFIQSGCSSPSTMERWVVKIQTLEEKKRRYENILRRELSGLDEEFESLRLLSQELSLRARGIRSRKAA